MKLSSVRNKIIIGFILVLIIFSLNFFNKEVKNFFYLISSPIQKIFWNAGQNILGFFGFIGKGKMLEEKNKELETKYFGLLAENTQLKELRKENDVLREALNSEIQKEFNLKTAEVISRDQSRDFILINKGLKDGIKEDMPVITQKKALLGKITEVYDNFSRVMLISSTSSSFDAKVSDSDILGLVKGRGGLNLEFSLVPKDKELKEGNIVVTSTLGGIFPKGLLIGEIQKIEKSDTSPFQSSSLRPFFDFNDLEIVFIIISK